MDDEKQFVRKLSSKSESLDKPEIAVEFARLLMTHKRYNDARLIIRTALEEGPRYDLYELRAASAHSNLEELWAEVHHALAADPAEDAATVYNEGLKSPDPDWISVLRQLRGD